MLLVSEKIKQEELPASVLDQVLPRLMLRLVC
jgi:hypothetical protein